MPKAWLRRPGVILALCCFVWLFPSLANAASFPPASVEIDLDDTDDTELFVIGNTLFAVYHELAHALIDLLDLPVIGREEDAADGFAALMMIPPIPDPVRDELIIAVADGWHLQSEKAGMFAPRIPLWGEHALDEQRYFSVICWMVGSDQEGFFNFAEESGMPLPRIEACADEFQRMQASWQGLLASHLAENGTHEDVEHTIEIRFDQPRRDDIEAFEWARTGRVIERSVIAFSESINLPEAISVRFASCDDANAFWQGDRGEVLICYGLIDDFMSILLGG